MVLFTVTFTFQFVQIPSDEFLSSHWFFLFLQDIRIRIFKESLGTSDAATGPRSERLRGKLFQVSSWSSITGSCSVCITVHFRADDHRGNHPQPYPHAWKQKESWSIHVTLRKKEEREWSRNMEVMRAASWTDDQPAAQCSMKIVLSFHGQGGHILWDFLHTGHQPTVIAFTVLID